MMLREATEYTSGLYGILKPSPGILWVPLGELSLPTVAMIHLLVQQLDISADVDKGVCGDAHVSGQSGLACRISTSLICDVCLP